MKEKRSVILFFFLCCFTKIKQWKLAKMNLTLAEPDAKN